MLRGALRMVRRAPLAHDLAKAFEAASREPPREARVRLGCIQTGFTWFSFAA